MGQDGTGLPFQYGGGRKEDQKFKFNLRYVRLPQESRKNQTNKKDVNSHHVALDGLKLNQAGPSLEDSRRASCIKPYPPPVKVTLSAQFSVGLKSI